MIVQFEKVVSDLNAYTKYMKSFYPDCLGCGYEQDKLSVEFSSEKTPEQIEHIKSISVPAKTLSEIIADRLKYYRTKSVALVDQILIENTLSGMSTADSAYLFTLINPCIDAIQLGALPTAYYIFDQTPVDTVYTQSRKDRYKQLIMEAMA